MVKPSVQTRIQTNQEAAVRNISDSSLLVFVRTIITRNKFRGNKMERAYCSIKQKTRPGGSLHFVTRDFSPL